MRHLQTNNLKVWREQASLTIEQLAEKLHISGASVSRIEKGTQQPRPELLSRIGRFFKVSESSFFGTGAALEPAHIGLHRIPLLDYVQAGNWIRVGAGHADAQTRDFVLTDENYPASVFALRTRGVSMAPRFEEGDLILVDSAVQPRPNDPAVFRDAAGEVSIGLYKERGLDDKGQTIFEAVPIADGYPSLHSVRQKLEILGTVVEYRKYLRK